jgi:hypothetical protein
MIQIALDPEYNIMSNLSLNYQIDHNFNWEKNK